MQYKNFSYCTICRTKKNLDKYKGKFEVTNLMNALYFTVMMPIEKRGTEQSVHIKSECIVCYLKEQKILNTCDNDFKNDDVIRYLRNGLAHFNIKINSDADKEKEINKVLFWATNSTLGNAPQYKEQTVEDEKAICKFCFEITEYNNQLKNFVDFMIRKAMESISPELCNGCKY